MLSGHEATASRLLAFRGAFAQRPLTSSGMVAPPRLRHRDFATAYNHVASSSFPSDTCNWEYVAPVNWLFKPLQNLKIRLIPDLVAGVVLSSVCVAAGRAMTRTSLVHAVLRVEQLMTAGKDLSNVASQRRAS